MKSGLLTKPMAVRNTRPVINDPTRRAPRCQAQRKPARRPPMPPDHQLRYPVLLAVVLCMLALAFLNFAMQM